MGSSLLILTFMDRAFGVVAEKSLLKPQSQIFFLMLSSKICMFRPFPLSLCDLF